MVGMDASSLVGCKTREAGGPTRQPAMRCDMRAHHRGVFFFFSIRKGEYSSVMNDDRGWTEQFV